MNFKSKTLLTILLIFVSLFFFKFKTFADSTSADLNSDGRIDIYDYNLLISKFGNPYNIFDYNNIIQFFGISLQQRASSPPVNTCPQPKNKTLVGVRFYMAYFSRSSNGHYNRNTHEQWLADSRWQSSWPYYTQIRSNKPDNVTIDIHQDNQEIIDQEILLSRAACLDYWALETSPLGSKFHLDMYLKSPYKNLLKFVLITPMASTADLEKWNQYTNKMIELFRDPQYVKINGRPLLYMEQIDPLVTSIGENTVKQRIADFESSVKNNIGKEPYLVLLNWSSGKYTPIAKNLGFDARALYNCRIVRKVSGAPYSDLVSDCESRWNIEKNSDLAYVPTAQVAYDPRARREAKTGEDADNSVWYKPGTPQQIANHVKNAINWVKSNPNSATANTVLIAAWSDYTEGGWLEPTMNDGNSRLNALSEVLGGVKKPAPKSPYIANPQKPHAIGSVTKLSINAGATFQANKPITITGVAPAATRLNFKLSTSQASIITTSTMNFYMPDNVNFTVTLDGLPKGGPYTLTISSPDIETVIVKNIKIN